MHYIIIAQVPSVLEFKVWDWDRVGSADDMGDGQVHVPTSQMLTNPGQRMIDQEIILEGGKNGKLFVGLFWAPTPTADMFKKPPTKLTSTPASNNTSSAAQSAGKRLSLNEKPATVVIESKSGLSVRDYLMIFIASVTYLSFSIAVSRDVRGKLTVEIKQGRNLVARDISTGKSDPFVIVKVGGNEFQTQYVAKNLNPDWNEETEFVVDKVCVEFWVEMSDLLADTSLFE
jgi:Ca2+-dependent lipid-binding protein